MLRPIESRQRTMTEEEQIALRRQRLKYLEEEGINPFPAEPPLRTAPNLIIRARANELIGDNQIVHSVGRLTAIREHKNVLFAQIDDGSGTRKQRGDIQIMFSPETDSRLVKLFKQGIDIGDIVRVSGPLTITKTGELTVAITDFGILAKALRPPPALKWKTLMNPDVARGQRYLELMTSPDARERFRIRSRIVQIMRERFMQMGNLEVETPILDTTYGGASARPFTTHHKALDQDMYMRISDELYLKRLIVGMLNDGEGGVFEFSKDFRNEGMDAIHHPEFNLVELYMPYQDYNFMMEMTEALYKDIVLRTQGKLQIEFKDHIINFNNWRRVRIYDGLRDVLKIDPRSVPDNDLKNIATQHRINTNQGRGFVLLELFEQAVLPYYGPDPLFVLDYPKETSPLTKTHRNKPDLVERFELFIEGFEVANCYSELNDPRDQRARFTEETKRKLAGDVEAQPEDEDFIVAMEYGLPPMGGIGFSIDRLVMLLTNQANIQDVILFPHRKK